MLVVPVQLTVVPDGGATGGPELAAGAHAACASEAANNTTAVIAVAAAKARNALARKAIDAIRRANITVPIDLR